MFFRHSACFAIVIAAAVNALGTEFALVWEAPPSSVSVSVDRGMLRGGAGSESEIRFENNSDRRFVVTAVPNAAATESGLPTLITARGDANRFTFRLSDPSRRHPIFLPAFGVAVTTSDDNRSYEEIARAVLEKKSLTKLQAIEAAPEAAFDAAAASGRNIKVETWLGVSRDMRIFRVDERMETFQPRFAGYETKIPENPRQAATYAFRVGRGWGRVEALSRKLDDGILPILHGELDDESVRYSITMFADLEKHPLREENIRGTDYLVADAHGHGRMFTPAQAELEKQRRETELTTDEEVVLHLRAIATNRGSTPQYAFLNTVVPSLATPVSPKLPDWKLDPATGASSFDGGRVFAVAQFNGKPLRTEEVSVLLQPGESATLVVHVPHRPVSNERAASLGRIHFETALAAARSFWKGKLERAARFQVPEKRIDEMVQAGLLHLDLIHYGRQPPEPLLPAIGIYTAIGSESAPIIQFLDSVGLHDQAERAIDFFLAKQHENGFMQNFNGYMLETGAVLWTMGEHFRYTRDAAWLQRVSPSLMRAADYLVAWRERNLESGIEGDGRGMLDGKTADPDDPYRSYMLNGYAYLGLMRAAEMLENTQPAKARVYLSAALGLRRSIRDSIQNALETSPVIPLGDGTWTRAAAPWTNYRGPVMLHADGGRWFTHGAITSRDSLLGPLYLVYQEVLSATDDPISAEMLHAHSELMTRDNVAFSQPYYSRHPWMHLKRGEVKPFLTAWYGSVASMADRETYTFTEHFFPASSHKTHEEAWFLMETRWLLYREDGDVLRLLGGAPRAWFEPGKEIHVERAATYYGKLTFSTRVSDDGQNVNVKIACADERRPAAVEIRIPHPSAKGPVNVRGGRHDSARETLIFENFAGTAEAELRF